MWHLQVEADRVVKMFLGMTLLPKEIAENIAFGAPLPRGGNSASVIWAVDPSEAFSPPALLVVADQAKKTLLPKLMAIPGNLSPITSCTRIWSDEEFRVFLNRRLPKLNEYLLAGLVGLTVSELALRLGSNVDLSTMGISAAQRTFSYSLAQLLCAGGSKTEVDELATAWKKASSLTSNSADDSYVEMVIALGRFMQGVDDSGSFHGSSEELAHLISMSTRGPIGARSGSDLFVQNLDLRDAVASLKTASREKRLAMVEAWTTQLRISNSESLDATSNLACGFLFSQIDPGSIAFMDLAQNADHQKGLVAAAYGMCAGLLGGTPFLWKGDGFGFTLVSRGLRRTNDLLAMQADISLSELSILSDRIKDTGFAFRTRHPSIVEVELVPDVIGAFANGLRRQPSKIVGYESTQRERDFVRELEIETSNRATYLLKILEDAVLALQRPPKEVPKQYGEKKKKSRFGKY